MCNYRRALNFWGTKFRENLWICEIITFRVKNFMIAAKFRKAWRGLIVAVVQCITTSLCLFLGCVLLIRSLFGWFCGQLGRWVACSLQLFCHAFVGHLASSIQKDGICNERGPVGLGNTAFEGLDFLKPAVILIKTWSMHHTLRSWKGHAPKN